MIPVKPGITWCGMFCLVDNHILESDPWIQIHLLVQVKALGVNFFSETQFLHL